MEPPPRRILPTIVLSQFCGTSLWFAPNAVTTPLVADLGLDSGITATITSSVQLGFVGGTLVFALASLADRISARVLFFVCSFFGAVSTAAIPLFAQGVQSLLVLRFLTGFFLAGVYPVGMKIAASWFGRDLGKALGFLVGALVLGTAFPHAVTAWIGQLDYRLVFFTVASLASLGGLSLLLLVPAGPLSKKGARFDPKAVFEIFSYDKFRAAAFGYFGHMWELYAFWATVPWIVARCGSRESWGMSESTASFLIIAAGAIGCVVAGLRSVRRGPARVAVENLSLSAVCCLLSPVLFLLPGPLSLLYLLVWGWTVVADSAQFSSLAAAHAPPEYVGSALTWMNCLGFGLTIFSVEALGRLLSQGAGDLALLALIPGPLAGLAAMRRVASRPEPARL